jgi:hypothetical protein
MAALFATNQSASRRWQASRVTHSRSPATMTSKLLTAWCLLALTVTIHAAGLSAMLPRVSSALADARFWPVTRRLVQVAWYLVLLHLAEITVWALFY